MRPCRELVDPPDHCGLDGVLVRLPCPAGRPDAVGGAYCDEHGGEARARAEAERDWNYLAPASVGDAASVEAAGSEGLDTTHAYVVVRPERGLWLAYLGVGSFQIQVANPRGLTALQRRKQRRGQPIPPGRAYGFAAREEALQTAVEEWRQRLVARVREIRAARGATLAWGVPVEPLPEPVVLEIGERENAWDAAARARRRGPPGLGPISGLRPTGEAA
jgi:hypothetical protein